MYIIINVKDREYNYITYCSEEYAKSHYGKIIISTEEFSSQIIDIIRDKFKVKYDLK